MIKVSDLRVGNLILRKGKPFWVDVWTFVQIHQAFVEHWDFLEECEGMPIDNDRLMDMGFEFDHGDWVKAGIHIGEYEECQGEAVFKLSVNEWISYEAPELKYIHELQNLFHSLTGRHHEIKQPA